MRGVWALATSREAGSALAGLTTVGAGAWLTWDAGLASATGCDDYGDLLGQGFGDGLLGWAVAIATASGDLAGALAES